ncbi:hypothetical protein B0H17DRAFT_1019493 [Mycena rosella]|uniref:BTB domain-containing protein n=1 Tax=Mycena rosella TaxID=1033263 RepID=A0AAD7CW10_MYCRO|nr:hypothetical protein B0H17DRAFT_1019493 [Mycena rosella]
MDVLTELLVIPPSSSLRPVPELWFKDASLIFQAETSLFRVYSGILAARSSVFRDMLSFPQPEPSDLDVVDGCPRIVLHDTAADVAAFFRAIFDSSFFVPPSAPSLDILGGILRLSIKYDVDYLTQRCLRHLSDIYPTTLKDWDLLGYSRDIINFRAPPKVYPVFQILELLKEVEAPWLVPAIMYLGCSNPMERIVDGVELGGTPEMSPEKRTIIVAYTKQANAVEPVLRFLKQRFPECHTPAKCNAELLQLSQFVADNWSACHFPLEIWEDHDWDQVAGDLCHACVGQCRKTHATARQEFWDRMPALFEVHHGWDELQNLKDAALGPRSV